jgi:hypothetical protein
MKQIIDMQRVFHPLYLQSVLGLDESGTLVWPPPAGLPDWVRAHPLTFTRVLPRDEDTTDHPDGLFELQYHVFPLELPDPAKADVQQGLGVDYEAQFLLADGGRSFDQEEKSIAGSDTITFTWGQAPVWPVFTVTMTGAGHAAFAITTTQGHMATVLVLDLSTLEADDELRVDMRTRSIYLNGVLDMTTFKSGDFPVLRGQGPTTVTYTNDGATTLKRITYRESDYI